MEIIRDDMDPHSPKQDFTRCNWWLFFHCSLGDCLVQKVPFSSRWLSKMCAGACWICGNSHGRCVTYLAGANGKERWTELIVQGVIKWDPYSGASNNANVWKIGGIVWVGTTMTPGYPKTLHNRERFGAIFPRFRSAHPIRRYVWAKMESHFGKDWSPYTLKNWTRFTEHDRPNSVDIGVLFVENFKVFLLSPWKCYEMFHDFLFEDLLWIRHKANGYPDTNII